MAVATKANSKKDDALNSALKAINSQYKSETGDPLLAKLSDKPLDVEKISSGSLVLDSILGGGFPVGRIIEIYGPESSGKTSIALNAAGYVHKQGGNVAFIDLENALDPIYAAKLGVDTEKLIVSQPEYGEQALDLVLALTETGLMDLIIVDSVANIVPKSEIEGDIAQQRMGEVARIMSKALRKLTRPANKNKCTVIFINQVREKIGVMFGNPETTPGGKALKFYASQRIEIRRTGQVKDDADSKKVIGTSVRLKVVKNKVAPPFKMEETVLTFNKGINKAAEMVMVAPDHGVILRPNTRTYIEAETDEVLGTSKAAAIIAIENDPKLYDRLAKALSQKIEESITGSSGKEKEFEDEEELEDSEDVFEEKIVEEVKEKVSKVKKEPAKK